MKSEKLNLFYGIFFPLLLVGVIWSIFYIDVEYALGWRQYGIRPRELGGLIGVVTSPFLHGSFDHLLSNTIPLLVLGASIFFFYRKIALRVVLFIMLMGDIWVWIMARAETNHIGASGLIYGLVSFLFFSGVLRKETRSMAVALLVLFLYGSMVWGIFPIPIDAYKNMSWEGHLCGSLAGIGLAFYYRRIGGPQRKLYQWEIDEMVEKQYGITDAEVLEETEIKIESNQDSNPNQSTDIHYTYVPKEGRDN